MREIKFRGIRVDNNEWVYGFYIEGASNGSNRILNHAIAERGFYPVEVKPETVGQYTGLKDKNSVEIYEGDILNVVCNWDSAHMQVLWEGSQFVLKTYDAIGFKVLDVMNNIEVIGNIHEQEA